jgi:hypothetical protein
LFLHFVKTKIGDRVLNIDLRKDAVLVREKLIKRLADFATVVGLAPICAIEVGYNFDYDGWIVFHAVHAEEYEPCSEWADHSREDDPLLMPQWAEILSENFAGIDITVTRVDGYSFVYPAYDVNESCGEDRDYALVFIDAVGEMIVDVLETASSDKLFAVIGPPGTIQVAVESWENSWLWPSYEDFGIINRV